jgi:hypothetical protein
MVTDVYIIYDKNEFNASLLGDLSNLFWGIDIYMMEVNNSNIYSRLHPSKMSNILIVEIGENENCLNPIDFKKIEGKQYYNLIIDISNKEEVNRFLEKHYAESETLTLDNEFYYLGNMFLECYIPFLISKLYYKLDVNRREIKVPDFEQVDILDIDL